MNPRVVHVISGLRTCGAVMMLYILLRAMGPGLFEHVVVSLSVGPRNVADRIDRLGIPVLQCGLGYGLPNPVDAFKAVRLIHGLRPDLLHGWMYHGNLAAQIASATSPGSVPVIWNI